MTCTLVMRDINDFGCLESPASPKFGIQLSHALIGHYVRYYNTWNTGYLTHLCDYESYVASIMETIEGFERLTPAQSMEFILRGVGYLTTFIDFLESMPCPPDQKVDVYTSSGKQRHVALLI